MPVSEFSDALHKRVLAFQRDHGLPEDGRLSADDWATLAAVATLAAEPAAEPVAEAEPAQTPAQTPAETTATPDAPAVAAPIATAQPVTRAPVGPSPADFPVLYELAKRCQDEESTKAYLLETTGLDLDDIIGNITTVLEEAGA